MIHFHLEEDMQHRGKHITWGVMTVRIQNREPMFISNEAMRNSNVTDSVFVIVKEPIYLLSSDYQTTQNNVCRRVL